MEDAADRGGEAKPRILLSCRRWHSTPGGRRAGSGAGPRRVSITSLSHPGVLAASGTPAAPLATGTCSCSPGWRGFPGGVGGWYTEKWFGHREGCESHPSPCLTPTLPTRASKTQLQGPFSLKLSVFWMWEGIELFCTEHLTLRLGG